MKIVVSIILILISATAINPAFHLYAEDAPQNIQSGLIPTIKSIYKENNVEMVEISVSPEATTKISAGRTGKIYFIDDHDNEENVIATIEVVDVPQKGLAHAKITGKSSPFQVESGHFVKFDYKFRLFGIVQAYVNKFFVYPERIKPIEILRCALLNVERVVPELLTGFEDSTNTLTVRIRNVSKTYDLNKIQRSKDMVEDFAKAAFATEAGKVSDPVKTEFGYHLIKVTARTPAKSIRFSEVKDKVREELIALEMNNLIKGLREKAKIEISL